MAENRRPKAIYSTRLDKEGRASACFGRRVKLHRRAIRMSVKIRPASVIGRPLVRSASSYDSSNAYLLVAIAVLSPHDPSLSAW